MKIKTIATGSAGNCYLAKIGGTNLLIEAGVPIAKIIKGLDYRMSDVDGCLISHRHL